MINLLTRSYSLCDELRKIGRLYIVTVTRSWSEQCVQDQGTVFFYGTFLLNEMEKGVEHCQSQSCIIEQHQRSRVESHYQSYRPYVEEYRDGNDYKPAYRGDSDLSVARGWQGLSVRIGCWQSRCCNNLGEIVQDLWCKANCENYRSRDQQANCYRRQDQSQPALFLTFAPKLAGGLCSESCYLGVEVCPKLTNACVNVLASVFELIGFLFECVACRCEVHLCLGCSLGRLSVEQFLIIKQFFMFDKCVRNFFESRACILLENFEFWLDYGLDGRWSRTHSPPTDKTDQLIDDIWIRGGTHVSAHETISREDGMPVLKKLFKTLGFKFVQHLIGKSFNVIASLDCVLFLVLRDLSVRCGYKIVAKKQTVGLEFFTNYLSQSSMRRYRLISSAAVAGFGLKELTYKDIQIVIHGVVLIQASVLAITAETTNISIQPCAELASSEVSP